MSCISKFEDLSTPLLDKWKEYSYDNCERKSEVNCMIKRKKLITKFTPVINEMFMDALIEYNNLQATLFVNSSKIEVFKYYMSNLKKHITPYGIKDITVSHKQFQGIVYQIFYDSQTNGEKMKSVEDIDRKIKQITNKQSIRKKYQLTTLIYKYKKNPVKFGDFQPSNFVEKTIFATTLLHNKSLEFLSKTNLEILLTKFKSSRVFFLRYRKFLFEKIDPRDHHKFMLFSSICLYLLGLRKANDLDLYISDPTKNTYTKNLKQILLDQTKDEQFKYVDFSIEGTELWKDYWNIWLSEWARLCGTQAFNNILVDSRFNFYWMGVKVISPECDIQRRIHRNRPRAYGDLIMLKMNNLYKFEIPVPNFSKKEFKRIADLSKKELKEHLDDGWSYKDNKGKKQKLEIERTVEIDKTRFISTVVWWLKTTYGFLSTAQDVKDMLHIPDLSQSNKPKNVFIDEHREFKRKMIKIKKMVNF